MQLKPQERQFIKKVLQEFLPKAEYRVFGSRLHGTAKTYSDIDIGVVMTEPIPLATLALLEEKLSESDLPYKVDLVDYQRISESFRAIIDEKYELL